jgi:hypothetical protein
LGKIITLKYFKKLLYRCSSSYLGTAGKWTGCCAYSGTWAGGLYPEPQQKRSRSTAGKGEQFEIYR